jgi:hypothetical protein
MRDTDVLVWILIGVGVAAAGCAARRPVPVVTYSQQLQPGLTLERSTGTIGDVIRATYFVVNVGSGVIDACFGASRGYNIVGSTAAKGLVSSVDHPACKSRFRLDPGQAATAELAIEVLEVGIGPARVNAWVQLVDPRRCHQTYGCDAVELPSPLEQLLTITEKASDAAMSGVSTLKVTHDRVPG